jgi:predicted DNA-binding transcriptional regulator AlpA
MQMELSMVIEEEEIMKTAEVSKRLGVTQAAISQWCQLGDFPHAYRVNPRTRSAWRIPKRDVEAFIEKRRKQYGYFYTPE